MVAEPAERPVTSPEDEPIVIVELNDVQIPPPPSDNIIDAPAHTLSKP